MRNKTRKFIWSAPLVAALAIIGALTLAGVLLMPNADTAQADEFNVAPAAPANVNVEPGDDSLVVTWTGLNPSDQGLPTANAWNVEVIESETPPADDATWTVSEVSGLTTLTDTLTETDDGVSNGNSYYVRVAAANDTGTDRGVGAYTMSGPHVPNVAPAGVTADSVEAEAGTFGSTLTVEWDGTTGTNTGGDVDRYYVRYRTSAIAADDTVTPAIVAADAGAWVPEDALDATPTEGMEVTEEMVTITGLDAGTMYDVQVTPGNAVGAVAFTTWAVAPGTAVAVGGAQATTAATISTPGTDAFSDSSTSSGAGVELKLTIGNLEENMVAGSSVELYLEDDFRVPDSIDRGDVYFIVTNPTTPTTNDGGRVYPTTAVGIDDDDHFGGDDDWSIQVFIPDMDTSDQDAAAGFNGPVAGQTLTLVITEDAGIKNPTEAGTHSVGYAVLGPDDDANDGPQTTLGTVPTYAKISLSDEDNSRGYELTVTGSGFNNGTSAGVYVLHTTGAAPSCADVIRNGTRVGAGTVGSDDKVAITFEVTVPTFMPGNDNYICMADGEGRLADGEGDPTKEDVEQFELEPSISISPKTANVGDTVTIFAQDFPANDTGAAAEPVLLASRTISTSSGPIGRDGSGTTTFSVPGWAEGTLRLDAWGEDTKLTVIGSKLSISKSSALPNELITVTGDGFGTGTGNYVDAARVTIDGVPLEVHEDSLNRDGEIDVSNSGQFVATVVLWPEDVDGTNPTLTAGVHTIKVVDSLGFSGSATITVPEPTVTLTPTIAGPRDVITIAGENWPVDNIEGSTPPTVNIAVDDGRPREYSALPDSAGRWFVEHRVSSAVAIPSTNRVTASVGSEIVKVTTFEVPAAIIEVTPGSGQPGAAITLMVDKMPVYAAVDSIQIAGRDVLPVGNFSTDRTGSVTVEGVVLPGLDPGTYSVLMDIDGTVAIGSVEVLAEVVGTDTAIADALAPLGDSLVAAFYFDNISKGWSFYDPRPEFAELNTLTSLISGEAYWVLVSGDVDDVVLNNKSRTLTCSGGDCWNLVIW
ncbi:MAG: hypothetical protein F4W95_07285 [Chloroflexi bacterium]|nr:hypothetical protein [Chloroflexota bacterium]